MTDPLLWSRAGGDPLTAIYGYMPTLHDARIVGVALEGNSATLRFEYLARAQGADRDLRTRFEFVFAGVTRLRMPLEETNVLDASMEWSGKRLALDLTTPGGWLSIEAQGMEIRLLAVDIADVAENPTLEWNP